MAKLKLLLKCIIAIALLAFLFKSVNFQEFAAQVAEANIFLIVIAALLAFAGIYLSVLKWSLFLKNIGLKISSLKLYSLYCISAFFNNFLPSTIGGDSYRFLYLRAKNKDSTKKIASSIVLERATGFISLFLVNLLLVPVFFHEILNNRGLLIIEAIILGGFLALIGMWIGLQYIRLEETFLKKIPYFSKGIGFIRSLNDVGGREVLVKALLYSMVFAVLTSVARSIVFVAFGRSMSVWYVLFTSTVVQIAGILPISLNSIGVTEGLTVFMYTRVGASPELSLAVALVGRVSQLITSSIGGLFYFVNDRISDSSTT